MSIIVVVRSSVRKRPTYQPGGVCVSPPACLPVVSQHTSTLFRRRKHVFHCVQVCRCTLNPLSTKWMRLWSSNQRPSAPTWHAYTCVAHRQIRYGTDTGKQSSSISHTHTHTYVPVCTHDTAHNEGHTHVDMDNIPPHRHTDTNECTAKRADERR